MTNITGDLVDVYRKFMSNQGWKVSTMDESRGDDGGFKSITLDVKGDMVYSKMKWEAGWCSSCAACARYWYVMQCNAMQCNGIRLIPLWQSCQNVMKLTYRSTQKILKCPPVDPVVLEVRM